VVPPGVSDVGVVSFGTVPCDGVSLGELVPEPVAPLRLRWRRRPVVVVSASSLSVDGCMLFWLESSGRVIAPAPVLSTPPGVAEVPLVSPAGPVAGVPLWPLVPVPPEPPPVWAEAASASDMRAIASTSRRLW
jgi:hypothetical protein